MGDLKIKAVVFDVDGTLAPYGEPVARQTAMALCALEDRGLRICLASGKPLPYLSGLARGIGLKCAVVIGENGAVLWDENTGRRILPVPRPKFFDGLQVKLARSFPELYFQENCVNITAFSKDIKTLENAWRHLHDAGYGKRKDISLFFHTDAIDILPAGVTKGRALSQLKIFYGWDASQVVAVGDGENDLSMQEEVRTLWFVGPGLPHIKEHRFSDITDVLGYFKKALA